ncbi:MAG TPA: GNAT family protein [Candidatus Limnocylindrales bacterium]|nr:GNAT family protein [Candidatus Limnocylindrales bacterium]
MSGLNWRGAKPPRREPIDGKTVRLEPLDPARHGEDLFQASVGADSTWDYLPYGPFAGREEFMRWLERRAPLDDPLTFTIIDTEAHAARGLESLMRMDPANGVIEIGHIWLSPALQRTRQATEAVFLMARYAFDALGNRRFEWKCNAANEPSRRAAERFGFVFEGVFRQHMVVKDRNRDTAWYSMTDGEWPARRAEFEAWLAPGNFDSSGRQRRSLADVRKGIHAAAE